MNTYRYIDIVYEYYTTNGNFITSIKQLYNKKMVVLFSTEQNTLQQGIDMCTNYIKTHILYSMYEFIKKKDLVCL